MRTPELGDVVRIASTDATVSAGYAERIGACFGFTTPSITGVDDVVGGAPDDVALNVGFDDGADAWFEPSLVIFVDLNAGQVATVGETALVRQPDGSWDRVVPVENRHPRLLDRFRRRTY